MVRSLSRCVRVVPTVLYPCGSYIQSPVVRARCHILSLYKTIYTGGELQANLSCSWTTASPLSTFGIAVDKSTFTGRQHLNYNVCRETINEKSYSISDMYNMFEYGKQSESTSMPYGTICAFFRRRTSSRPAAGAKRSRLKSW